MANYYWVGGSALWDASAGNKWANSSGGTTYYSTPPTSADDVFFDAASGAALVSISAGNTGAKSINCTGFTGTLGASGSITVSGDITLSAGMTFSYFGTLTINANSTLTTAGKTFSTLVIDGAGITVTLGDNLNLSTRTLTVTQGTFSTSASNYSITAGSISSSNTNTRTISLNGSTVTLSGATSVDFSTSTNLTFNAGTSTINIAAGATFNGGGRTFYNVVFSTPGGAANIGTINGANTFNNVTIPGTVGFGDSTGTSTFTFGANQTINGTLSTINVSVINRVLLLSDVLGTARTLTCAAVSLTDADFKDITLAGAAAGTSITRAGDCGGNSGITFPAPKTVYWNLAGTQSIQATGWALSSGGTPAVNNFPLAQDTIVFDNAGAAGTVTMGGYNFGTVNLSARTNAMTLSIGFGFSNLSGAPAIYGNWTNGSGVTLALTNQGQLVFSGRTTQTITSSGISFASGFTINNFGGTVTLADNLTTSRDVAGAFTLANGTLNLNGKTLTISATGSTATFLVAAGTKNITFNGGTLSIASWSFSAFNNANPTGFTTTAGTGTGTITLTSSLGVKRFIGGGSVYNCTLDQGGSGELRILGANTFNNITNSYSATGATSITFDGNTQTCANITATGSVGKVLTINGGNSRLILPSRLNTGSDYIAVSNLNAYAFPYFVGANSTVTNCTNVVAAAYVIAFTHYWVGGTGTWDTTSTANWSNSSGGASGSLPPLSDENVIFNQAGTYTVTLTGNLTCQDLTVSAGTVTFAQGTSPTLSIFGSMSLVAATVWSSGETKTFNAITTGKTITTNGVTIPGNITFDGVGGGWSLGSDLICSTIIRVNNGTFSTSASNYNITSNFFWSQTSTARTISLNNSTVTLTAAYNQTNLALTPTTNLTFNAGNSKIILNGILDAGSGLTFYDVEYEPNPASPEVNNFPIIIGSNTFNNLTFKNRTFDDYAINTFAFAGNQTINGTLSAINNTANRRMMFISSSYGSAITLTCAAVSTPDCDFRDITIAGAAAPVSPTRAGDCGGNSGITFPAPKTVYKVAGSTSTTTKTGWATTSGGASAINNFPLAQDTMVFDQNTPTAAYVFGENFSSYNWGTLNTSTRSSALTLNITNVSGSWYGDITLSSAITLSTSSPAAIPLRGRKTQNITSAGVSFPNSITVGQFNNTTKLLDNLTTTVTFTLLQGTLDLNGQTLTTSNAFSTSGALTRNITFNGGTIAVSGTSFAASGSNFTTTAGTGTGKISFTSASASTFSTANFTYNCTLDINGAGGVTIAGSTNVFNNVTNSYASTGATSIIFNGDQTFTNWSASGTAGKLLTVRSISTTARTINLTNRTSGVDYLNIQDLLMSAISMSPVNFYAGPNSRLGRNSRGFVAKNPVANEFIYVLFTGTSFAVPHNWNSADNEIHLFAGGGGGAGSRVSGDNRAGGAGGGGGGYTKVTNLTLTPYASVSFAIGAAGAAGAANANGTAGGNTTFNAGAYTTTGGGGGQAATTPSSTGGTAGTGSTFNGGVGGVGSTSTVAGTGNGGGGGGGAGGPLGVGATGGNGFASTTAGNVASGGGGGNGGGSTGGNASSATGGTGGNNNAGAGGGSASAGFNGGGGAGNAGTTIGFAGGSGTDIANAGLGGGGGAGGSPAVANTASVGGLYGGGGGGAGTSTAGAAFAGSAGGQGAIIIWYRVPSQSANGNFFFLFG